jgi:hypothetical protein
MQFYNSVTNKKFLPFIWMRVEFDQILRILNEKNKTVCNRATSIWMNGNCSTQWGNTSNKRLWKFCATARPKQFTKTSVSTFKKQQQFSPEAVLRHVYYRTEGLRLDNNSTPNGLRGNCISSSFGPETKCPWCSNNNHFLDNTCLRSVLLGSCLSLLRDW